MPAVLTLIGAMMFVVGLALLQEAPSAIQVCSAITLGSCGVIVVAIVWLGTSLLSAIKKATGNTGSTVIIKKD